MSTNGTEDNQREISIITANTGYITVEGNGEKRRRKISELLKNENPTLVLLQMFAFRNFDVSSGLWSEYDVPSKYKNIYTGDEANFLYDETKLNVASLDKADQKTVDEFRDELRKTDELQLALGRMPMVVAKTNQGNAKFLCVSFHGLYKINDERKWLEFEAMLRLVAKVSEEMKLPFIIGGGFNLNIRDASDFLKEKKFPVSIVVHSYEALSRREKTLKRDFFIGSKSLVLEKVHPYDWNKDPNFAIFTHDPIVATLMVDELESEIIKGNIKKEIKKKMEIREKKEFQCNKEEIKKKIKEEIKNEIQQKFQIENNIEEIKDDIKKRAKDGVKKEIKEEIKDEIKEEIEEEIVGEKREDIMKTLKEKFKKEIENQIKEEVKEEIIEGIMKEMKREIIEKNKDNIEEGIAEEIEREIKADIMEEIIKKIKEDIIKEIKEVNKQMIKDLKETIKNKLENEMKKGDRGNACGKVPCT